MNKKIIIFSSIIILLGSFYIFKNQINSEKYLEVPLSLIIANDPDSREKGLSGKEKLLPDSAMLFVFQQPDRYGIWMKDMKFPIDIIWLDENYKVVYFKENARPDSYPEIFLSPKKALYVLESNIDFIQSHDIQVGNYLHINNSVPYL